ncbi:MAG: hypothetical protein KBC41_03610, partial [Candidatus Pacebacteria bacterium]|nr:hypothetical protein [Candidatus Paceibacterota bacterium]
FLDSSRNLSNIGTITSGLINGQTISSTANFTGSVAIATTLGVTGKTTLTNASSSALTATNLYSTIANLGAITGTTATLSGAVTASQFNGSGAGLTSNTVPIASLVAGNYSSKITSGTYSININGVSSSTNFINAPDGDRNAATKLPTTSTNGVRYDFVSAASAGTGGNYAGLMTYAPWTGTTASTGDASYQLAFGSTATNGGGIPQLNIRKGIDSTWNSWYTILHSGNVSSYAWTSSNDGAGSGLDADTLDGLSSASFMTSATDNWLNTTGDSVAVGGYVGLNGGTTYGIGVNSANRNSGVFDTVDSGVAGDALELNWYTGTGV